MDTQSTSVFRKKLVALRELLSRQIARLRRPVDMGSDVESTYDGQADETEEETANAGMVETLKRRAHRVDDALNKMDKGTYGRCEKCGAEIEKPLLDVDPESRYCRACKAAMR